MADETSDQATGEDGGARKADPADESLPAIAEKAHKRWGPLIGIASSALSVTAAAAIALASRASVSDMNEAKTSIKLLDKAAADLEKSVDTLKADFKAQTDAVVATTTRQLDRHGDSIKAVGTQLLAIEKQLSSLQTSVQDLKDRLPR